MSNSAFRNGGAILFLTILTLTRFPVDSSLFKLVKLADIDTKPMRRTLERFTCCGFGVAKHHANLTRSWLMKIQQVGFADGSSELPKACDMSRAADPSCFHPYRLQFRLLGKGGNRVNYYDVN